MLVGDPDDDVDGLPALPSQADGGFDLAAGNALCEVVGGLARGTRRVVEFEEVLVELFIVCSDDVDRRAPRGLSSLACAVGPPSPPTQDAPGKPWRTPNTPVPRLNRTPA